MRNVKALSTFAKTVLDDIQVLEYTELNVIQSPSQTKLKRAVCAYAVRLMYIDVTLRGISYQTVRWMPLLNTGTQWQTIRPFHWIAPSHVSCDLHLLLRIGYSGP